jgi:nucleoid-associated protein YgaU
MKQTSLLLISLCAGTLAVGCSSAKKIDTTTVPKQAPVAEEAPKPKQVEKGHYTVVKHDTLWDISGKSAVYGDAFQWPLLFKSNRDKIQDPDLIYPKQDLEYKKAPSADEVEKAKKDASDTPKYKPHSKPVNKLPVDYF